MGFFNPRLPRLFMTAKSYQLLRKAAAGKLKFFTDEPRLARGYLARFSHIQVIVTMEMPEGQYRLIHTSEDDKNWVDKCFEACHLAEFVASIE